MYRSVAIQRWFLSYGTTVSAERLGHFVVDREVPAYVYATVNLHASLAGVRDGVVEVVWPVDARGYDVSGSLARISPSTGRSVEQGAKRVVKKTARTVGKHDYGGGFFFSCIFVAAFALGFGAHARLGRNRG